MHNVLNSQQPTSQKGTSSSYSNVFRLLAEPAIGYAVSTPLDEDIDVRPSTMLRAKKKGLDEHFVHLIQKITLLAIEGLERGGIVNSTMLCSEIRYGLRNDATVDCSNVAGLDKGERLEAGKVIWLLADAGELPLVPLGRNLANLQQYRVS
jgi:hypothetical protein